MDLAPQRTQKLEVDWTPHRAPCGTKPHFQSYTKCQICYFSQLVLILGLCTGIINAQPSTDGRVLLLHCELKR